MQEHVAGLMGNVRNTCIKNIQIVYCVTKSIGHIVNPFVPVVGVAYFLGNTILVKLELWELVIVFNNNFYSATNLCPRYASAKCGR